MFIINIKDICEKNILVFNVHKYKIEKGKLSMQMVNKILAYMYNMYLKKQKTKLALMV